MVMKKQLNKSLVGFEVELFTINGKGRIVAGADTLIKRAKKLGLKYVKKECSKNVIELAADPDEIVPESMGNVLDELEKICSFGEKKDIFLCPLGTYPGSFNPVLRRDNKHYDIKESILGKNRFKIEARCCGLHCHYTLPRGTFDAEVRMLKLLVRAKIKNAMVNSYNMMIAADPALTTFMQSSPFYQQRYFGKDSRVIMYRGGKDLKNEKGAYSKLSRFGGLPQYKLTTLDLIELITNRYESWMSFIDEMGINIKTLAIYGSILDTTWNPVRVNAHGTLEQRGMDMNHPKYIVGIGGMIKFVLKKLQEEHYAVVPSDIGIKEPFKIEGDIIYIPPHSYVKKQMQYLSAYEGLDNEMVYDYCKRFLKLTASCMPKEKLKLIAPFKKMIENKKTVSDHIIDFARRKGYKNKIPNQLAAEIALNQSKKLVSEVCEIKEMISNS
ncbi:hypothetical protein JXA85_01315 [Candidatus Woesearchaeota archaeon]|nr:hypothetical protein [Candidatus Woesearchaeota archaeon]